MKKVFLKMSFIFLLIFNILAGVAFFQNNLKTPNVIFLNVGQGDSIMIIVPNNTQIIVDGGDGKNILEKIGKYMPFYDRKIELLILTHPDKDHMGGLVEILKYYKVDQILQTGIYCETAICKEWDLLIAENNVPVNYAKAGQKIKAGNASLNVLHPFKNLKGVKVKNDNDSSIVLKLDVKKEGLNYSYLLTGDAGFGVENKLMDKNINIKSDTLKVSHHGSKYATSNEFLKVAKPKKAVISVGKNGYGHPSEDLIGRLENVNIEIFRTDKMGDLIFY